jgi:hypothetical protein
MITNKEEALAAEAQNGAALPFVLRRDRDVAISGVSQNRALQFASPELQADRDFVLAAVAQNWRALRYVSAALKGPSEFIGAAAEASPCAIRHASIAQKDKYRQIKSEATEMAVVITDVLRKKLPGFDVFFGVAFIKNIVGLVVHHTGFGFNASMGSIKPTFRNKLMNKIPSKLFQGNLV